MAHFLLGEIYLFKSKVDLALDEFRKELQINPILWLAYWRMGDAYTRVEKWDEAENALKQAIWLNQNFTGPYVLLGKVELKKGDAGLAVGFLEKALKMDPNNYSAHYLLASAYKQMGRTADASREFELTRTLRSDEKQ
jgi:Flp pilus assembly protein TadD